MAGRVGQGRVVGVALGPAAVEGGAVGFSERCAGGKPGRQVGLEMNSLP
jgi:hypothetical protein